MPSVRALLRRSDSDLRWRSDAGAFGSWAHCCDRSSVLVIDRLLRLVASRTVYEAMTITSPSRNDTAAA